MGCWSQLPLPGGETEPPPYSRGLPHPMPIHRIPSVARYHYMEISCLLGLLVPRQTGKTPPGQFISMSLNPMAARLSSKNWSRPMGKPMTVSETPSPIRTTCFSSEQVEKPFKDSSVNRISIPSRSKRHCNLSSGLAHPWQLPPSFSGFPLSIR